MKRLIIGTTIVLMLIGFVGFHGLASAAENLLIGSIAPLSGPAATWGLGGSRIADMWAAKVNGAGGLKIGGKIYEVKHIAYDHKASVAESATLANRMVYNDNVKYIVHTFIASCVRAIHSVTEPNKVFLGTAAFGNDIIGPDKPYCFRVSMTDNEFVILDWEWIAQKYPKVKSVAIIAPNDVSGWKTRDTTVATCNKLGIKVVSSEVYERGTTDFSHVVTSMLAKKPDAIAMTACPPGDAGMVLKEANIQGFKGIREHPSLGDIGPAMKIAGAEACEGLITSIALDMESPLIPKTYKDLASAYQAKYRDLMPTTAREVIIALEMLTKAWEKAGTVDVDRTITELEKVGKVETVFGPAVIGGKEIYGINRQTYYTAYISQVKNGKVVMLERFLPPALR